MFFVKGVAMSKLYMIVIFICSMITSDASAMYAETAGSQPAPRRTWHEEVADDRLWAYQMAQANTRYELQQFRAGRNRNPRPACHVRRRVRIDLVQDNGQ